MMMGFGILVFMILGVIVWKYITDNNDAKTQNKEKRKAMPQTAHEILDERYANDEVTGEEYLAISEDIKAKSQYQ